MMSLSEWAAQLRYASAECRPRLEATLAVEMGLTAEEARGYPGQYQAYWPGLSDRTIADKIQIGASPPDNPLLRTGELKESIDGGAVGLVGYVGNSDAKAIYHEFGTSRMPPRQIYSYAMERRLPDIIMAFNMLAVELLTGAVPR